MSTLTSELNITQKSLEDTKVKLAETLLELEESQQKYESAQEQEKGDTQSHNLFLSSELEKERNKDNKAQTWI
eukprot:9858844-Ditylum_brightwellii.AAC.2